MKKSLTMVLSLLVAITVGVAFMHCGGDDNGEETCPAKCGDSKVCCADCPCPAGQTCNADGTACEGGGDCCPSAPQGQYHIDVAGQVRDTSGSGVAAAVAAISPMEALTVPEPTKLSEGTSDAGGLFSLDCFDVTNVALGAVIMADDAGWDGAAGTYFPTGTGVIGWDTNEEKVCVEGAAVMIVDNATVAGLDQLPDLDSATQGFVMGMVVSAAGAPVAGAVVKKADGSDLTSVYYPDGADLTTGTSTSASGAFVLPALNFTTGIVAINAEKDGMTFEANQAAPKAGFCYFVMIQEAS